MGEYIIANGENRQFVIYWYQAHGRSVANEYLAKVYMARDVIQLKRTGMVHWSRDYCHRSGRKTLQRQELAQRHLRDK